MKLSLCETASKGDEQMWCREVDCSKCTINLNFYTQIPGFSVIEKMQEWMGGGGGNYVYQLGWCDL